MTGEEHNAREEPFRQLERLGCDDQLDRYLAEHPEAAWSCDRDGHAYVLEWSASARYIEPVKVCALCGDDVPVRELEQP
jgi:hypothetical protein